VHALPITAHGYTAVVFPCPAHFAIPDSHIAVLYSYGNILLQTRCRPQKLDHNSNRQLQTVIFTCPRVLANMHSRINVVTAMYEGHGSAVGIATGYGMDDRGVGVPVSLESRIFTSS
jgi:hypothetical protein